MLDENPYATPKARLEQTALTPAAMTRATRGQRFLNLVIDTITVQAVIWPVGAVLVVLQHGGAIDLDSDGLGHLIRLFALVVWLTYYATMEAFLGRTIGKFVTGTRVVNERGGRVTIGQVLGRTVCRLIPFEAFSLLGSDAVGWHDSIPKTRVVRTR